MLSMPYEHTTGKELSMTVLLPKGNNLTATEAAMTATGLSGLLKNAAVPA